MVHSCSHLLVNFYIFKQSLNSDTFRENTISYQKNEGPSSLEKRQSQLDQAKTI